MTNLLQLVKDSVQTGAVVTLATTAATAVGGAVECDNAIAPINAVSHIAWGDKAARRNAPSWKYTAMGLVLNSAAVTSWAVIYEFFFGKAVERGEVGKALVGGAAISACAYVTDYYLVPDRFTPGFEKRLSNRSLFGIYSVLAVSLALGALCRSRSRN